MIDGEKNAMVCKISIIDNGPGIHEEIKDSIFFPMITGKDKGTGLGLIYYTRDHFSTWKIYTYK